jgi:NAD+ diphosphatase
MKNQNVFAGAFVDRQGERRKDPDWLDAAIDEAGTRFVPVWHDKCLVGGDPPHAVMFGRDQLASLACDRDDLVFLGLYRGHPAFTFALEQTAEPPFRELGEFHDLRYLGSVLPADEANLVAHARALVIWHRSQRYCGVCGSSSPPEAGGNSRRCANEDCGRVFFPRVDPAIIVLVTDGDRCLLGRQPSWPPGRYSTIAGFVEPGESLEDAIRREVYEETNVRVASIRYHSSQPWPFPSSLMLGFTARATTRDIALNDGELEDAGWFTRKALKAGYPEMPFGISIARRLIEDWLEQRLPPRPD